MLIGHFGVAQIGKALRRDLPLGWVVFAAYLPDVVRVAAWPIQSRFYQELFSHSIPAVTALALAIAAVRRAAGGALGGALVLAALCMLHWPADVLTGCKPTTAHGSWVGFILYRRPVSDLLIECSLLLVGWWLVQRRVASGPRLMHSGWAPLGCIVLQVAFLLSMYAGSEFFVGDREWMWRPLQGHVMPQRSTLEILICRPPDNPGNDTAQH
jgi:hypothetical protein